MTIVAYRCGAAVTIAPMQCSQILSASVDGTILFSDVPQMATVIGATIITASGVCIVLREDTRRDDSVRPVLNSCMRSAIGTHPRIGRFPPAQFEGTAQSP